MFRASAITSILACAVWALGCGDLTGPDVDSIDDAVSADVLQGARVTVPLFAIRK